MADSQSAVAASSAHIREDGTFIPKDSVRDNRPANRDAPSEPVAEKPASKDDPLPTLPLSSDTIVPVKLASGAPDTNERAEPIVIEKDSAAESVPGSPTISTSASSLPSLLPTAYFTLSSSGNPILCGKTVQHCFTSYFMRPHCT